MLAPIDITDAEGLPDGDYLYIHKFEGYTNYVYSDSGVVKATTGDSPVTVAPLQPGESVVSVVSVGKTLIVFTDKNTHYSVWKDNTYSYLGTKIPEPVVKYDIQESSETYTYSYTADDALYESVLKNKSIDAIRLLLCTASVEQFDNLYRAYLTKGSLDELEIDQDTTMEFSDGSSIMQMTAEYIWAKMTEIQIKGRLDKNFIAPIIVRTAVKLYDESYIYQSVPFLVGNTSNQHLYLTRVKGTTDNDTTINFAVHGITANMYIQWDLEGWEDIISSVDIGFSTDICNPLWNDVPMKIIPATSDDGPFCTGRFQFSKQNGWDSFEDIEGAVLSKVNFYKVKSFSVEDFLAESAGGEVSWRLEPKNQDDLVVLPTIPDGSAAPHTYSSLTGATAYNMRSIIYGVKTDLTSGCQTLQSTFTPSWAPSDQFYWKIKYFIRTDSGDTATVLGRNENGSTQISNYDSALGIIGFPYGLFCYPDSRCYKVEIYYSYTDKTFSIPMKEHPGLNCAYALCDLNQSVLTLGEEIDSFSETENPSFVSGNTLMMSDAYNPFRYDLVNMKTFQGKIVGVAPVTMAVSTQTFGRSHLYVFSEEGIDAISINADGSFGTTGHVSRDVAIEGTIRAIDKAIVFITEKGVMLLSEDGIEYLSPFMNGRHEKLEQGVVELLSGTEWQGYVPEGDESFMAFIKQARPAYDYAGSRLIFFNEDHPYQYVFSLASKSWHKMLPSNSFSFQNALNSFPECFVVAGEGGSSRLFDFSTHLDASLEDDSDPDNDQPVLPGIIETRAFGLDADDTYKVIRRIRIRGEYTKGRVKYVLLASHDGRDFRVIHSFRGPSWKYYKLVVLSQLRPTERISFAEIDYDVKFTDRIR